MTLQEAIDADIDGVAIGYTDDGRIGAEVHGPGNHLSKRKRRKRGRNATVWIWTPPKPDTEFGYLSVRSQVRQQKLHEVAKDKRRMLDGLNWRPRRVRSVIDRLARLIRR